MHSTKDIHVPISGETVLPCFNAARHRHRDGDMDKLFFLDFFFFFFFLLHFQARAHLDRLALQKRWSIRGKRPL